MPRSKKTSRSIKKQSWLINKDTIWIVKGFLTPFEKMALISFYRDKINKIIEANTPQKKGEIRSLDSGDEHDLKRYGKRIEFITEHF